VSTGLDSLLTLDQQKVGVLQPRPQATLHVGGALIATQLTVTPGLTSVAGLAVSGAATFAGTVSMPSSGLVLNNPTLSNANLTGTTTMATATLSGSLTVSGAATVSGRLVAIGTNTAGIGTAVPSQGNFEVQASGGGASMISFHRPGAFAAYFGIDTDNQWALGGWSMGATRYVVITDTQVQTLSNKSMSDPHIVGVSGNFSLNGNDLTNYQFAFNASGYLTLPAPGAYKGVFRAVKAWGAATTVNCGTTCIIPPGSNGTIVASFVINGGDSVTFWCDGANWWGL